MKTTIAWFSGGVTSAVATKIAIEQYENVSIYFCETGEHHDDNKRFFADCEKWFGKQINILTNAKWKTVDAVLAHGYINGPNGAYCTKLLKKDVRIALEKIIDFEAQIFGFEYETKQIKRAKRFLEQYPTSFAHFPLIDSGLTKQDCLQMLVDNKIEIPAMYRLGYSNNNCIGCVKGGMGYWNKIRKDFPHIFKKRAKQEREAGHSCIKGKFLDELDPDAGRFEKIELPECGIYCEVEGLE